MDLPADYQTLLPKLLKCFSSTFIQTAKELESEQAIYINQKEE
jgi:hypothetical protein